jgi:hypothetical protein
VTFELPAFAARQKDSITRWFCDVVLPKLFQHRANLKNPFKKGDAVILPAFPELLERQGPNESAGDYKRRRSDGMRSICAVMATEIACCNWVTMETEDPNTREPRAPLSVERLAELAELSIPQAERAQRALRAGKPPDSRAGGWFIAYTEHFREELADGRHVANGPSKRKLRVEFFAKKCGKVGGGIFTRSRATKIRKAQQKQERAERDRYGADLRISGLIHGMIDHPRRKARKAPSPSAPPSAMPSQEEIDAMAATMPDPKTLGDVIAKIVASRAGIDSS